MTLFLQSQIVIVQRHPLSIRVKSTTKQSPLSPEETAGCFETGFYSKRQPSQFRGRQNSLLNNKIGEQDFADSGLMILVDNVVHRCDDFFDQFFLAG